MKYLHALSDQMLIIQTKYSDANMQTMMVLTNIKTN
jgi:hypothetical protein